MTIPQKRSRSQCPGLDGLRVVHEKLDAYRRGSGVIRARRLRWIRPSEEELCGLNKEACYFCWFADLPSDLSAECALVEVDRCGGLTDCKHWRDSCHLRFLKVHLSVQPPVTMPSAIAASATSLMR